MKHNPVFVKVEDPVVIGEQLASKHLEMLKQDILKYQKRKKFNVLYDVVIRTIHDLK